MSWCNLLRKLPGSSLRELLCNAQSSYAASAAICVACVVVESSIQKGRSRHVGLYGQAQKCIWWMPRQLKAMKDVVACDKPRGVGKQTLIRGFPNGETHHLRVVFIPEFIGYEGEPGELKYLSTWRKRNQLRFP